MDKVPGAAVVAQGGKARTLGYYASEVGIASVSAIVAVVIGTAIDLTDVAARVLLFLAVFGVAFGGLVAYRLLMRWRMGREMSAWTSAGEAQMNRAKNQFIGNVSHGLRTPLTGIVGFAHVLKEQLRDPGTREAVDMIIKSSADLGRVVDDLLVAARLDAGVLETKLEDVGFKEQLATVLEFTSLGNAGTDVDCQDAALRVDPELFRHVLRNLLVNAHTHGRPPVVVRAQVHSGRYICDVADSGPGVPGAVRDQLFTRFAHGDHGEITGNVGLGLSVVKQLCRRMGIEVSYRRHLGMSHFVLSVPLAEAAAQVDVGARRTVLGRTLGRAKDRAFGAPA